MGFSALRCLLGSALAHLYLPIQFNNITMETIRFQRTSLSSSSSPLAASRRSAIACIDKESIVHFLYNFKQVSMCCTNLLELSQRLFLILWDRHPRVAMADKLTRIAIVNNDRCRPKKCRQECKKSCPVVRMGN